MKYLATPIAFSIMLITLISCDNETDFLQKPNDSGQLAEQTSEESLAQLPIVGSENTPMQPQTSSMANKANGESQKQGEPFALSDFRSAINTVVKESVQEETEKAVENDISKNAEKKK